MKAGKRNLEMKVKVDNAKSVERIIDTTPSSGDERHSQLPEFDALILTSIRSSSRGVATNISSIRKTFVYVTQSNCNTYKLALVAFSVQCKL